MVDSGFKIPNFLKPLAGILPKSLLKTIPSFIDITILGIVFIVFNVWYRKLTEINPFNLNEAVLAIEPTQYFKGTTLLLIPFFLIASILIWGRRHFFIKWSSFEWDTTLKLLVGTCVCLLSWAFSHHRRLSSGISVSNLRNPLHGSRFSCQLLLSASVCSFSQPSRAWVLKYLK